MERPTPKIFNDSRLNNIIVKRFQVENRIQREGLDQNGCKRVVIHRDQTPFIAARSLGQCLILVLPKPFNPKISALIRR